jgi:DNA-binding response OmpR family regulator
MKILVIDDEKNVRHIVSDFLMNEGYEVVGAVSGEDGINKIFENNDFDLILLDIRMPKMDGYETIKEIREITDKPVIFLTALNESYNEAKGLNMGAEDYIIKPFNYTVLLARVKAALRKREMEKIREVSIGDLNINMMKRDVSIKGESLSLSQKEYEILELLMNNGKKLVERQTILDRVWGYDYEGDQGTLNTHIKTLRSKLGDYAYLIVTVRGVGYRFETLEK